MFNKIITTVYKRLSFLRNLNGKFEITPHRDWGILIGASVFVAAVFVALAVYVFVIINSNESVAVGTVGVGSANIVHTEKLQAVLTLFSEKENLFKNLFNISPQIIDPSL
ncbi:MAG: hypothetical protein HYT27_02185 [Parcubacteria group bacterium]|nr:hypothetical protein [Parcubacteria group bacterium]